MTPEMNHCGETTGLSMEGGVEECNVNVKHLLLLCNNFQVYMKHSALDYNSRVLGVKRPVTTVIWLVGFHALAAAVSIAWHFFLYIYMA